jgi:hypothetical protein
LIRPTAIPDSQKLARLPAFDRPYEAGRIIFDLLSIFFFLSSEAAFSISMADFIIASIERHRRRCENKPVVHSIRRMAPLR